MAIYRNMRLTNLDAESTLMKIHLRFIHILLLSATLLVASLAQAQSQPADVVQLMADRVIERLRAAKPLTDNQAYELVEDLILPHLDFEAFARLSLGKYWRQASPEQRVAFTREFRDLLMRSYATSLNSYSGERIEQLGQRDDGEDRVMLQTQLIRTQGAPIRVDYRLRQTDGVWKVYDVVIDGISLVITYRTSLGEEISREGLDALIQKMTDHKIKVDCIAGAKKGC